MAIYLDHAASSPVNRDVLDYYRDVSFRHGVNPSSNHQAGKDAHALLEAAKKTVQSCFGAEQATLITTSGGTEAINQALQGYETPRRFTPHLVISAGEHKAVSVVAEHLKKQGMRLSVMPLNRDGAPDFAAFSLDPDHLPTLISVILLSNETGAVTDIKGLVAWRDRHCPDAVIHVDAVQAAGKMAIEFDAWGIDFLSVSGHKWGAPMGVGFLLAKSVKHLTPLIRGASQQNGLRAGSENAPLVAATAYALKQATDGLSDNLANAATLKAQLLSRLAERNIEYRLISPPSAAPFIVTIAFPLMGETLARVLSDHEIYVGRGAACSGGKASQNSALTACGVDALTVQRAIRISFGKTNTEKDMVALVDCLEATLAQFTTKS